MKTRKFHISDILSVSTGRLVSDRHMDGLYDLMGHITNDDGISTIGLMAMAEPCQNFLLETFPELRQIEGSSLQIPQDAAREKAIAICKQWVAAAAVLVGKSEFDVPQMQNTQRRGLEDDLATLDKIGFKGQVIGVIAPESK